MASIASRKWLDEAPMTNTKSCTVTSSRTERFPKGIPHVAKSLAVKLNGMPGLVRPDLAGGVYWILLASCIWISSCTRVCLEYNVGSLMVTLNWRPTLSSVIAGRLFSVLRVSSSLKSLWSEISLNCDVESLMARMSDLSGKMISDFAAGAFWISSDSRLLCEINVQITIKSKQNQ